MNSEERLAILRMLATQKISVEEAEMLLNALEEQTAAHQPQSDSDPSQGIFDSVFDTNLIGDLDIEIDFGFKDFDNIFEGLHFDFTDIFSRFDDAHCGGVNRNNP